MNPRIVSGIAGAIWLSTVLSPATGCAQVSGESPDMAAARTLLEAVVIDPTSIRLSAVHRAKADVVCGVFNAKNRFGGYAGPRRFAAMLSTNSIFVEPDLDVQPRSKAEALLNKRSFEMILLNCLSN